MPFATTVRRWLSPGDEVIYECRNCGTVLEPAEWTCSSCGSAEVAEYDSSEYEVP